MGKTTIAALPARFRFEASALISYVPAAFRKAFTMKNCRDRGIIVDAEARYSRARVLLIDEVGNTENDTPVFYETLKNWQDGDQRMYPPCPKAGLIPDCYVYNSRLFCFTGNARNPRSMFTGIKEADYPRVLCIDFGTDQDDGYSAKCAAAVNFRTQLNNPETKKRLATQWYALMVDYAQKPIPPRPHL